MSPFDGAWLTKSSIVLGSFERDQGRLFISTLSIPSLIKWETTTLKADFFFFFWKEAVLWSLRCSLSYMAVVGLLAFMEGMVVERLAWGQHLLSCLETYIIDPEVSTGPVVLLILWDHLHSDVSISYGIFCEWPVMVTFHLEQEERNFWKHAR